MPLVVYAPFQLCGLQHDASLGLFSSTDVPCHWHLQHPGVSACTQASPPQPHTMASWSLFAGIHIPPHVAWLSCTLKWLIAPQAYIFHTSRKAAQDHGAKLCHQLGVEPLKGYSTLRTLSILPGRHRRLFYDGVMN